MNLYVGNLPFKISEEELKSIFSEYGNLRRAIIVMNNETGRSRGFGFVEFDNKDDGEKAISGLNGKEIQGRSIIVNESKKK